MTRLCGTIVTLISIVKAFMMLNVFCKLIIFFYFISSFCAHSAELILGPTQIHIRSIADWEQINDLEVFRNGQYLEPNYDFNSIDFSFIRSDKCEYSYKLIATETEHPNIELCPNKDSIHKIDKIESFIYIGDTQEFHSIHAKTGSLIAEMIESNPDIEFGLNTGDIVDKSNETE